MPSRDKNFEGLTATVGGNYFDLIINPMGGVHGYPILLIRHSFPNRELLSSHDSRNLIGGLSSVSRLSVAWEPAITLNWRLTTAFTPPPP